MFKEKIREFCKIQYYKIYVFSEFCKESLYYSKNFMLSSVTKNKLDYRMLMIIHSIEKGLCNKDNARPFAKSKVEELIKLIEIFELRNYNKSFAYNLALSILEEYCIFYEKNSFIKEKEYDRVSTFLSKRIYTKQKCGMMEYKPNIKEINYLELVQSRHSVRNFSDEKINLDEIKYAISASIASPSACNRQMIKTYYYPNSTSKNEIVSQYAQGLSGFDKKNINYCIITYDENSFCIPGEKNQGMFNAGLFSMNFVNALHSKNIGSCFIQFGNKMKEEKKLKEKLGIKSNERVAVIIALGKYKEVSYVPISCRKSIEDILVVEE